MLVARLWDRIWNGVAGALCSTPEGKNKYEWAVNIGRKYWKPEWMKTASSI
jgi:hypothetical protein